MKRYNNPDKYYVYAYLDPRKAGEFIYDEFKFDFEPFYIGKGCRSRYSQHLSEVTSEKKYINRKVNKLKRLQSLNITPLIIKVKENMLDEEAYKLEERLIRIIGRISLNTGPLTNVANGGKISPIDAVQLRDRINNGRKIFPDFKGEKNPMYGIHRFGKESPRYGIPCKEETKKILSEKNKGKSPPNKGVIGKQTAWNKGKKGVQTAWNKGIKGICKSYLFLIGGELIIIEDLQQYCKDNNLNYAAMVRLNSKGIPHYDTDKNYYKGYSSPKFKL